MTSEEDTRGLRREQCEGDMGGLRGEAGSRGSDTGDELGDYKEPQEEELSLLGHSLDTNTPVPIIRAPLNRHKHYSAGINCTHC